MLFQKYKKLFHYFLIEINNIVTTLSEGDVTSEKLLASLVKLFHGDLACYYVRDSNKNYYRKVAMYPVSGVGTGKSHKQLSKLYRPALLNTLLTTKKITFLKSDQIRSDKSYISFDPRTDNAILIPIEIQGELLALIILSRFATRALRPEEEDLCNTISTIISLASSTWLSREPRDKQIEFLKLCSEIDQDLGSISKM